jgi:uncharacterized phage protein gp47/JayE
MSFEQQSASDVLTRLKADLATTDNAASMVEGSFNSDMLTANSIEFGQAYNEMNLMMEAAFAGTSWGDYLTMRAAEFGVIRKEATAAVVNLQITGTAGASIIKDSLFATAEDLRFYTLSDATVGIDGTVMVKAQCGTAGIVGNIAAGAIIKIPYSIPGITAVKNDAAATDGYDQETDTDLLARYLLKVRTPATSGNIYHYQQWALSVAGVGQVKILPLWNGNGTVKVIIVDSNNATASDTLIKAVADYIETVRPIGATVTVTSPAPLAINIAANITGTGDAEKVKVAANAYFKSDGFSLTKVSIARIGKILLDSGITDYAYDSLKINGSNQDIILTDDQLPTCGTVIFSGA